MSERKREREFSLAVRYVKWVHTKGRLPSGLACGVAEVEAEAVRCERGSGEASAARTDPPGDSDIDACRL